MGLLLDVFQDIARFFPIAVLTTLIFGGIALNQIAWVVVGSVGFALMLLIATLHYWPLGIFPNFAMASAPSMALLEACAVLPGGAGSYDSRLTYWLTSTVFLLSYVVMNASQIVKKVPEKAPSGSAPVLSRKGVGVASLIAALILVIALPALRSFGNCETVISYILGTLMGGAAGVGLWYILNVGNGNGSVLSDIHGVLIGTSPGTLRTGPLACA
jgi:hypothetical protein